MARFLLILLLISLYKCSLASDNSAISISSSSGIQLQSSNNNQSKKPHHLVVNHSQSSTATSLFRPSFLYSSSTTGGVPNPYPVRTMIGNLMFRLRQHRTQMLLIPSILRIVYQYRRPIVDGLAGAYQSLSASNLGLTSGGDGGTGSSAVDGDRISDSEQTDQDQLMTSASSYDLLPYQQQLHYSPMFNVMRSFNNDGMLPPARYTHLTSAALYPTFPYEFI